MAPLLGKYEDDIDQRTRWWSSYPASGFNERANARETLDSFVSDAFIQPRMLARTASATNLTYYRDAGDRTDKPVMKSPSFSSLAPSHALPYDLRVPARYLPTFPAQKTETHKWYHNAYAPQHFSETHRYGSYLAKQYRPERIIHGRTWYYPGLMDSPRLWPDMTSYVRGSMNYYDRCTNDRVRYNDTRLNYVYDSYDRGVDYRYLRFMKGQPGTFCHIPVGLPVYHPAAHKYRMFRINNRVVY